jgi:hypothetical protein
MTGQELIDLIQSNCYLDKEIMIKDGNGNLFDVILDAGVETKRDPYDGDFDQTVSVIELYKDVIVKQGE